MVPVYFQVMKQRIPLIRVFLLPVNHYKSLFHKGETDDTWGSEPDDAKLLSNVQIKEMESMKKNKIGAYVIPL